VSRWLDVVLGLALGAGLVHGGAFVLDVASARAEAPELAPPVRSLPLSRTADALPIHVEHDARKTAPTNDAPTTTRYAVSFHHLHTHEVLPVESADRLPDEEAIARFLRCRATWDARTMSPEPVAVAVRMATAYGRDRIDVISGFRSPKLNELLRKKGREVARESRHIAGEALDFRIPGVSAVELAASVTRDHVGGVGTYPVSGFVHVDVGPARRWRGR
jgi:uncharacterized protein YcbK (DUF882 family)